MSDKVKIRVYAGQKIYFDQVVEITRERWEQLKATPEKKMEDGDIGPLGDLIDYTNPTSWDDYDDIEMWVVDEEGKQVKPVDEYYPE